MKNPNWQNRELSDVARSGMLICIWIVIAVKENEEFQKLPVS